MSEKLTIHAASIQCGCDHRRIERFIELGMIRSYTDAASVAKKPRRYVDPVDVSNAMKAAFVVNPMPAPTTMRKRISMPGQSSRVRC